MRARLTVAGSAIAALVCVGVSALFIVMLGNREAEQAALRAAGATEGVLSLIRQGPLPPVLPGGQDEAIQVLDERGRVIAATPPLVGKPPMATFRPIGGEPRTTRTLCPPAGLRGCRHVLAADVTRRPEGTLRIYAAAPMNFWYGNRTLLNLVVGASMLMTALMAVWTFRSVARTLAPVDAIAAELAEITATDLHRRVPVPAHQDEIRFMAETVNGTLDRLQGTYEQLRRFTSDASHELRSPITAIRTRLEEALLYPDDTDWPQMTTAVLTSVERLQVLMTDLLTLARLDADAALDRRPTDLARLVTAELDRRTHRVPVHTDLQEGVVTDCDRPRLTRLLSNLLDNADRHATSQITVVVRNDGPAAVVEIADDGPGIPAELRESVFGRFTRLDTARSRDAGGTGLGLPIARQLAQAHGGCLTIEDSPRGARFVLRMPRYEGPPAR
ncbi:sensor histidine kinase [Actinomadura scrupuli]|uniref:sensor histidine kinase n=1 Tax=Actinomadura scrupuli TaxID=559629 RepID=UPI003D97574A